MLNLELVIYELENGNIVNQFDVSKVTWECYLDSLHVSTEQYLYKFDLNKYGYSIEPYTPT